MATESNTTGLNFHLHRQAQAMPMRFQSSGMEVYYGSIRGHGGTNFNANVGGAARGMVFFATPGCVFGGGSGGNNPGIQPAGSSFGSLLLDTVHGLKHDAGLAVEWSVEEQYKLEEGLVKFADEPSIMKYIKIAAVLWDKTVRDVALRCRWMTDRIKSCLKTNTPSPSQMNMASYSIPLQALYRTRHLVEENNQALGQISANLTTLKLQENVDLFLRTRGNLTSILNNMRNMPGIMSQMPPLPVFINEELASFLLSSTRCLMFGSPCGFHLKQELGF